MTPIKDIVKLQSVYPNSILSVDNDCWSLWDPDTEEIILREDEMPESFLLRVLKHYGIRAEQV